MTYKELQEKDERDFPYIVDYRGDFDFEEGANTRPFQFQTWQDALKVQVFFNSTCGGHIAVKRPKGILTRNIDPQTMECADEHYLSRHP